MKNAIKNCKKYFSCNYLEKIMDNNFLFFSQLNDLYCAIGLYSIT